MVWHLNSCPLRQLRLVQHPACATRSLTQKKARRSGPFIYAVGHLITYQQLPILAEDNREGIVELGVATSAIRAKLIREIGMQRLGKIGAGRIRAIF